MQRSTKSSCVSSLCFSGSGIIGLLAAWLRRGSLRKRKAQLPKQRHVLRSLAELLFPVQPGLGVFDGQRNRARLKAIGLGASCAVMIGEPSRCTPGKGSGNESQQTCAVPARSSSTLRLRPEGRSRLVKARSCASSTHRYPRPHSIRPGRGLGRCVRESLPRLRATSSLLTTVQVHVRRSQA